MKHYYRFGILILLGLLGSGAAEGAKACRPTEPDMLGPFYKPDAPMRSSVGKGYALTGIIRSAADCEPIPGAEIEVWLVGPGGEYDDAHRATVIADASGAYRFETSLPRPYGNRPPHIHLRVGASGFKTLVTQHYPIDRMAEGVFDVVLVPAKSARQPSS